MKKFLILLATLPLLHTASSQSIIEALRSDNPVENYRGTVSLNYLSQYARAMTPEADGEHYLQFRYGEGLWRNAYADTASQRIVRFPRTMRPSGFSLSEEGHLLFEQSLSPIYRHSYTAKYFLPAGDSIRPLVTGQEAMRDASLSPDGSALCFSSHNNLYIHNIEDGKTVALTSDGKWNEVINGTTDWVYEEEFGFTKAYAFSPDSRRVAYLKFDEKEVPLFEMMRYDGKLYNKAFTFKYPKAGDRNAIVELYIYDRTSGTTRRVDTGSETDQYIPHLGWTPAGELYFYRENRRQNLFEVIIDRDGAQQTIYTERSDRYVERPGAGIIRFIDGDRFLVREETTAGWWHLYLHSVRKGRLNAVTTGQWEVTGVVHCDGKRVWYTSTEQSPLRRDLYRVDLSGKHKVRLSEGEGWHAISAANGRYYVDSYSNASTPAEVTVHRLADGRSVRPLIATTPEKAEARAKANAECIAQLPRREFVSFVTERGDSLNGYILRPVDFDPAKRYPVLMTQYSGPGSQEVRDRWGSDWTDALPWKGYIVVAVDGRGTGFRGEAFKKQTYGQLGRFEVEDQISVARYLAAQPWVDSERIGIYGWSFGGFMALSCALKGEGLFRAAIAVAPVTSWRFYDSIYTETYNGLPSEKAEGYDRYSPLNFEEKLSPRTRLILIHGTADDNVHFQNTMEMARRLNRQGSLYQMAVYPDQNHSMYPDFAVHVRARMIAYVVENL